MKKLLILAGTIVAFFASCYDDKGVYDYHEINDIIVELSESISVPLPMKDSVLVKIEPKVSQVFIEGDENLRYLWEEVNTAPGAGAWKVCGRERVCQYWVKPTDQGSKLFRLTVLDTIENIRAYREVSLRFTEPYSQCWFILQEVDGQCVVGAVDGSGSNRIPYANVCDHLVFTGKPICLAVNNDHVYPNQEYPQKAGESILQVMTSDNGYQLDLKNLSVRYQYNQMLLDKRNGGVAQPNYATTDCAGDVIIDNGMFWFAIPNGLSIYYPVSLASGLGGSYHASIASTINDSYCFVFDDANKRFLVYENSDISADWWNQRKIRGGEVALYDVNNQKVNGKRLELVGENATAPNVFDPDQVNCDKVVYMGAVMDTEASRCMAIATNGAGVQVYEFDIRGFGNAMMPRCSGYFEFTPAANAADCKFATSSYFDRMFFYAAGNKIYRVDLNRNVPEGFVIYEHPDENAKFTTLRFLSNRKDFGRWLGEEDFEYFHVNKILGAVVENSDGSSSFLEMDLTGGGEVKTDSEGQPEVFKFDGFKNVVDIAYVYK